MSTPEENIAMVKKAGAALLSGDVDGFFADFAPDAELLEPAALPYGGVYKSLAEVRRGIEVVFATFEEFNAEIIDYYTGKDTVILHATVSGTGRKTGKRFSLPVMEIYQFVNGKIKKVQPFYFDTAYLSALLG